MDDNFQGCPYFTIFTQSQIISSIAQPQITNQIIQPQIQCPQQLSQQQKQSYLALVSYIRSEYSHQSSFHVLQDTLLTSIPVPFGLEFLTTLPFHHQPFIFQAIPSIAFPNLKNLHLKSNSITTLEFLTYLNTPLLKTVSISECENLGTYNSLKKVSFTQLKELKIQERIMRITPSYEWLGRVKLSPKGLQKGRLEVAGLIFFNANEITKIERRRPPEDGIKERDELMIGLLRVASDRKFDQFSRCHADRIHKYFIRREMGRKNVTAKWHCWDEVEQRALRQREYYLGCV